MTDATALSEQQFLSIVQAAVLAPSADNNHVVRFKKTDSGIALHLIPGFLDAPRGKRILGLMACGAVLENIKLRALALGFASETDCSAENMANGCLAQIRFHRTDPISNALEQAIATRHSNRKFFRSCKVSESQRNEIEREVSQVPGTGLLWLDESERRSIALRLVRLAETQRFRSFELHQELFSAVRFEAGWTASVEEGLPPGALEVEAPLRPLFALLRHWPVMRVLQLLGAHVMIGARASYVPCRFSPHLAVITAKTNSDDSAINAGRALQRVWLRAAALGIAAQPLAASALYALTEYPGVPDNLHKTLCAGWKEIAGNDFPFMALRMGYASVPTVRSARLPVQSYIV